MPVGVVGASEVVPQWIQTCKQMVQSQSDFDDDNVCQGPRLEVVTLFVIFFFPSGNEQHLTQKRQSIRAQGKVSMHMYTPVYHCQTGG